MKVQLCLLLVVLSFCGALAVDSSDPATPSTPSSSPSPSPSPPAEENAPVDLDSHILPWERVGYTWSVLSGDNSTNCTECEPATVTKIGPMQFCNAPLLPSWFGAIFVGLIGGWALLKQGPSIVGARATSIPYLLYAIMITSGMVVHCVFLVDCGIVPPNEGSLNLYAFVAYADAVLTSCIAVSFLWAGLVDMRWISESKCHTWLSMILSYVGVALGYIYYPNFNVMYVLVVLVGCGGYILLQLLRMYIQDDARGIAWFLAAGVAGAASFSVVAITSFACMVCEMFGGIWILEAIWYYGADVTMAILLRYILATRSHVSGVAVSNSSSAVPYTRVASY